MPIDNSASIGIRRYCFFVYSIFFAFRPKAPLIVCEMCGMIGNEMRRERKHLVTKRWGGRVEETRMR